MSHELESDIDLSLSCGSSSFDEGEIEVDVEDNNQQLRITMIHLYQFESYSHKTYSDNANSDISERNADRLQNTQWCEFYKCSIFLHVGLYIYICTNIFCNR